eukprot:CAMPEP_0204534008 /NCGR_PEP_ID=MMETSP0661-20131031/12627_1 /ASSEMBLY_ACC=CAM_ASM_000606 /TAXON_ID=109239 /ORGANISM="Alexandrium margalefi, Strain AMGDE01CS-322" /LENGTH=58 /DNA_ID=CAMNT_0051540435 /DNA_START=455 /DNA_END=631 /DNA_ORIENTATION=+
MSSPTGPAEQFAGGSTPKSCNSFWIRFNAMPPLGKPRLQNWVSNKLFLDSLQRHAATR